MAEEFKFVPIPAPEKFGPKFSYTMLMFVEHFVVKAKVFTSSMAGIHIGLRIVSAFSEASAEGGSGVAKLRKEDWVMLKDIVEEPKECGFPTLQRGTADGEVESIPLPLATTARMGDAILDATSKAPEPPKEEAEPEPAPVAATEEAAQ